MSTTLTVQHMLLPVHLAVLASLHAVLATSRAARLAVRLARLALRPWQPRQPQSEPPSLAQDLAAHRWSKLPRHLAVSLVGRTGRVAEVVHRERHVAILKSLLDWSTQLGTTTLTVYDETGVLVRDAAAYARELDLEVVTKAEDVVVEGMVTLAEPGVDVKPAAALSPAGEGARTPRTPDEDLSADSSTTLVADEICAPSAPLRLNLLSRAAGRPRLAKLARDLALRVHSTGEEPTSEQVAEQIDALPLGEPDLLLIFGGSYLRLHGFPPWQLRLTEMYHHSWPTWFWRPPELTYDILRKALDVYGRAEMRLGR
ncbi:hypothetical protein JCM3774_002515 [Rhodotorula dairenensis]